MSIKDWDKIADRDALRAAQDEASRAGAAAYARGAADDDNPHRGIEGEQHLASAWRAGWKGACYRAMSPEQRESVVAWTFERSGIRGDALRRASAESMGAHADLKAKAEAVERIARMVELATPMMEPSNE